MGFLYTPYRLIAAFAFDKQVAMLAMEPKQIWFWGFVTPPQAVGATATHLLDYGRGGFSACPRLRPKGCSGRLAAAYELPGHQSDLVVFQQTMWEK